MNEVRRRDLWLRAVVAGFLAVCSLGCHDALGPEKMITTTVLGSVKQAGKPLSRGWIEFIPVDGTVGRMRSARIQKDGSFQATKVPVGLNLIRLVNADIENDELRWGLGSFASPIRRTIAEKPDGRVDIDVFEEYQKAAAAKAKLRSRSEHSDQGPSR
jgi:hypothetical protein